MGLLECTIQPKEGKCFGTMDKDEPKLPRRRGRPLGSKKKLFEEPPTTSPSSSTVSVDDERPADSPIEEKLTPFSSLLRSLLHQERAEVTRVAHALDVAEITVYRWMNGSSEPRTMHLKRIPAVMEEHRSELAQAIHQTFPGVLDPPVIHIGEVKKDIYRRVLEIVATTSEDDSRYWQVTQAIFEYALFHLDPDQRGFAITYASLMPARENGIHSLREAAMRGSDPWPFSLESRAYLGSTTLAGTAAMLQRPQTWNNLDEERSQVDIDEFERSAFACPVMYAGRLSGVLIGSSTQSTFFEEAMTREGMYEFAQLFALGLRNENFYPGSLLQLRPMPPVKWQRQEIGRTYINRIITYARRHTVSRPEAEQRVLSEMEREFEELARDGHKEKI